MIPNQLAMLAILNGRIRASDVKSEYSEVRRVTDFIMWLQSHSLAQVNTVHEIMEITPKVTVILDGLRNNRQVTLPANKVSRVRA